MRAKLTLDRSSLDDAFDDLENQLSEMARGIAVTFWDDILARTPQMWGEMAASWTFSVGSPEFYDRSWDVQHVEPLYKGHAAALMIANDYNAGNEVNFRLGQTAWITNGVDHAQAIEDGEIRLRQVNRPGMPIARAMGSMYSKFSRGISYKVAQSLRTKKIEV